MKGAMKIFENAVIRDKYQAIIVGAGIGGLTAAAMLAKRGLYVLVVEQHYMPGGTCGAIRRQGFTIDTGATVLYGFGEKGLNSHRFVMNELEEEIDMISRDAIYHMHVGGEEITFWRSFQQFLGELVRMFPAQEDEIRSFYNTLYELYRVIAANDLVVPPTELSPLDSMKMFMKNPVGTLKMGMLTFKNAESIFRKYFTDRKIIAFFDMLTRTFSYVDAGETPAVLSATMFADNHEGGAYYPVGSPQMLPNKLEKALEKYGGQILYRHLVDEILIDRGRARGVRLADGTEIKADAVISDATIWNLYGKLVRPRHITPKRMSWAQSFIPNHSNLMIYLGVDEKALPEWTRPMEIFIEDMYDVSGHGITVYISSKEDPAIAPPGCHAVTIAVVTKDKWPRPWDPEYQSEEYQRKKQEAADGVLSQLEKYFPDFRRYIKVMEIGTPSTMERFTLKNWGNVGGPKQMIGQEMMKRLRARSEWKNLYLCGDSTVMGLGVLPATVSGVGAANMVLRDFGKLEYKPRRFHREYIRYVKGSPWTPVPDPAEPITTPSARRLARECQHCEDPGCRKACPAGIDVLQFLRRIESGNYAGAVRSMREMNPLAEICGYVCPAERLCEKECNRKDFSDRVARIKDLQRWVCQEVGSLFGWERYVPDRNGHRVAIVGAGPAGLTCGHFLARLGYDVEIFEKAEKAGGLLTHAVPLFHLPEEVVVRELREIAFPGITFHYGQELGNHFTVIDLLNQYHAIFLAPGLWAGRTLEIPGASGVEMSDAFSFLSSYRERGGAEMKDRVLVVGGGSVAADAALAAKKSGARQVSIACLENESEMPALPGEVDELKREGIEIHSCWGPNAFPNPNKLSFFRCTSVLDGRGAFCPAFDESRINEIEFDQVIMAVGQETEPRLARYLKEEFGRSDRIDVDPETGQVRGRPGVYAGGDIVRGAGTVVEAVADGRKAAVQIDSFIQGRK